MLTYKILIISLIAFIALIFIGVIIYAILFNEDMRFARIHNKLIKMGYKYNTNHCSYYNPENDYSITNVEIKQSNYNLKKILRRRK